MSAPGQAKPREINTIDNIQARLNVQENGCRLWPLFCNSGGYGVVAYQGRRYFVHRLLYEQRVRPVPDGYELHHVCRNRRCANVDHLREVTRKEHIYVEEAHPAALKARQTHCKRGHEFTEANTRRQGSCRKCKRCVTDSQLHRYHELSPEQRARRNISRYARLKALRLVKKIVAAAPPLPPLVVTAKKR